MTVLSHLRDVGFTQLDSLSTSVPLNMEESRRNAQR